MLLILLYHFHLIFLLNFDFIFLLKFVHLEHFINSFVCRLGTGWSFHTNSARKFPQKSEGLNRDEQDVIMRVIEKAEKLEVSEQERIGWVIGRSWPRIVALYKLKAYTLTSSCRHVGGTSHCFVRDCDLRLAHFWQLRCMRNPIDPQGRAPWDYDVIHA